MENEENENFEQYSNEELKRMVLAFKEIDVCGSMPICSDRQCPCYVLENRKV